MRTPSERVKQGLPEEGLPKKRKKNGQAGEAHVVPEEKTNGKATPELPDDMFEVDGEVHDIWERRMINPETKQGEPIHLKRNGLHLRWINLSNNGRYQRAKYDEGWLPVTKDMLLDEREIYGVSYSVAGEVCRGEKQQEMLMWMPEAVFKKIQARKHQKVLDSQKKIKDSMLQDVATKINDKRGAGRGDEVVERATSSRGTDGAFRGQINFGSEAVEADGDEGVELGAV